MARSNAHPVLAFGNLTEGILGIVAVASGIISLIAFGPTMPLVISFVYSIGVTALALFSAYHLYF